MINNRERGDILFPSLGVSCAFICLVINIRGDASLASEESYHDDISLI